MHWLRPIIFLIFNLTFFVVGLLASFRPESLRRYFYKRNVENKSGWFAEDQKEIIEDYSYIPRLRFGGFIALFASIYMATHVSGWGF